ncbi:WbqC family protein [Pseudoalteromonas viridis]|uniref:WbqC family protein n=2 Tax=Pseudoalteromonas viridis TaxID=339617 RepID=A0ABX7V8P4_9GAMM|nr:WbqC family protein [Pseudoalteromonas viridis]
MQPTYIPWMGYFDLIRSSDKFVFLDDVKLEKSSWHVRNRIRGAHGEIMLSQVVATPEGRMSSRINTTEFKPGNPWRRKHLKAIAMSYAKTPYYKAYYSELEHYILNGSHNLAEFNIGLIKLLMNLLKIDTPTIRMSELGDIPGAKDVRLRNLCLHLGANVYLSPAGARDYIEQEIPGGEIAKAGVEVRYQHFEHPVYQQAYQPFISHLGVIDALFNLGQENTLAALKEGGK